MKKKTIGRIAALSLAGLTALPAYSIVASAADVTADANNVLTGDVYYGKKIDRTGVVPTVIDGYFISSAARDNAGYADEQITKNIKDVFGAGTIVYINSSTGEIKTSKFASTDSAYYVYSKNGGGTNSGAYYTDNGLYNRYNYASDYMYWSEVTGRWYPNLQDYLSDPNNTAATRSPVGTESYGYNKNAGFIYFDTQHGYYTNVYNANTITLNRYEAESSVNGVPSSYPTSFRYASGTAYKKNNVWYPNRDSLYAATGSYSYDDTHTFSSTSGYYYSSSRIYFDTSTGYYYSTDNANRIAVSGNNYYYYGYWYSSYTNQFYATEAAALAASLNNSSYVHYVGDYYNGYYGYYYGYDPTYYYYYYYLRNGNDTTSSSSSSSTIAITDTSSWTTVANRIKSSAAGKTISIDMKDETIIPASVFSALKGKNVTVSLKLSNGVVYTINGKNVTSASDVNVITAYNTDRVPSTLVKAAYKKYNAVSSAQVSISSNAFGAKAGVTFKFNTKRAGCTARLYRYNSGNRTLSLVDTSKVESTGACTFEGVAKGGDFVIILS